MIIVQPSMLLHELCHALHFRVRTNMDSIIETSFKLAETSGKYNSVWYWHKTIR